MLLPVDDYLPVAVLPPHLSPFDDTNDHGYIPPEKQKLIKMKLGITDPEEKESKENGENRAAEKEEKKMFLKTDVKANKKEPRPRLLRKNHRKILTARTKVKKVRKRR